VPGSSTIVAKTSIVAVVSMAIAAGFMLAAKTGLLEAAAFVSTVVSVFLLTQQLRFGFVIGVLSLALYAYYYASIRLLADMTLQFFFMALSAHGWLRWGSPETLVNHPVRSFKSKHWMLVLGGIGIGSVLYLPVIEHFKGAQPKLDTTLAVASVAAQLAQNFRFINNWAMWIIINCAYVYLYVQQSAHLTALLFLILILLAVKGWIDWSRSRQPELLPSTEPGI
jgi:nicotinamide mononucleotide transporter